MTQKAGLEESILRHIESQLGRDHGKVQGSKAKAFSSQGAHLPSPLGSYVEGIIHLFYRGDDVVRGDPELQAWCREITEVGLCQAQNRGESPPQGQELLGHSAQAESGFRTPTPHATPSPSTRQTSESHSHLLRLRTILDTPGSSSAETLAINLYFHPIP